MDSVILIGMPASGKSTAGKLLAERLGLPFLDGDDLIRARTGMTLPALIEAVGTEGFLRTEEEALCSVPGGAVIAPGGSAVYSPRAMAHLKSLGKIVYLRAPLVLIEARIPDFAARGVVMRGPIGTLEALYAERTPLYERYADLTVEADGRPAAELAAEIAARLQIKTG